jgi:hypothetical protein
MGHPAVRLSKRKATRGPHRQFFVDGVELQILRLVAVLLAQDDSVDLLRSLLQGVGFGYADCERANSTDDAYALRDTDSTARVEEVE